MMKKLLLLTLCLMFVLCGCGQSQTANNQSSPAPVGGDFKFWLSENVPCKAGETCTVEIRLSPNSQVAASDLIIEFDAQQLSFEGFKAGGAFTSESALQGEGKIKVTSITLNPPKDEALIGTLTFKANQGASGETKLKLTSETCANIDLVDMTPVCFSGSVVIK